MYKLTLAFGFLSVILSGTAALPTDIPILRPGNFNTEVEATTEDLEAIVVEAATTTIDGILVQENNENGSGSSVVKEFDPNDCFLVKERGPCRAAIDSWFFNVGTKSCENFSFSGCGGNNNRFPEKSACETHCAQPTNSTTTTPSPSTESIASSAILVEIVPTNSSSATKELAEESSLPSSTSTSTTSAPISTSSYKPKLPDCPKFDGCSSKCVIIQDRSDRGCKKCLCGASATNDDESKQQIPPSIQISSGNLTVAEPVGSVSGLPSTTDTDTDDTPAVVETPIIGEAHEVCQLPAKRGHCRAMQTRYRYDSKIKDCVQFHYGGCDANPNNFVSKEKCLEYCKGQ